MKKIALWIFSLILGLSMFGGVVDAQSACIDDLLKCSSYDECIIFYDNCDVFKCVKEDSDYCDTVPVSDCISIGTQDYCCGLNVYKDKIECLTCDENYLACWSVQECVSTRWVWTVNTRCCDLPWAELCCKEKYMLQFAQWLTSDELSNLGLETNPDYYDEKYGECMFDNEEQTSCEANGWKVLDPNDPTDTCEGDDKKKDWNCCYSYGCDNPTPAMLDDCACGIKLNTVVPFIGDCIQFKWSSDDPDTTVAWPSTAFPLLMGGLSKILVTAILVFSFVLVIVAGVMMTTGGFSESNFSQGKQLLMKVIAGLALLWASGIILKLINPNFFG